MTKRINLGKIIATPIVYFKKQPTVTTLHTLLSFRYKFLFRCLGTINLHSISSNSRNRNNFHDNTHCSSNLIPQARRCKSSIFSAHGVNVSLVYSWVVERQCLRSECRFLKFSMYSIYETRSCISQVSSRFLKKKNFISRISRSAYLLYPQYQNSI